MFIKDYRKHNSYQIIHFITICWLNIIKKILFYLINQNNFLANCIYAVFIHPLFLTHMYAFIYWCIDMLCLLFQDLSRASHRYLEYPPGNCLYIFYLCFVGFKIILHIWKCDSLFFFMSILIVITFRAYKSSVSIKLLV